MLSLPFVDGTYDPEIPPATTALEPRGLKGTHLLPLLLIDVVQQEALAQAQQFLLADIL